MSQEILAKLAELKAGQEAMERRLSGRIGGLEKKLEQDHEMTMDLLAGLSKSVEMLVNRELGPRPVARR